MHNLLSEMNFEELSFDKFEISVDLGFNMDVTDIKDSNNTFNVLHSALVSMFPSYIPLCDFLFL